MKPEGVLRHFLVAFGLALAGYCVFYGVIEHRRVRNGPWEVTFTNSADGRPLVAVSQPRLGISNVNLRFEGVPPPGTNLAGRLIFSDARPVPYDLPFGRCVFMDTTFLPGTIAMEVFGHEVELLPRVLVIDRQERAWAPAMTVVLNGAGPAIRAASITNHAGANGYLTNGESVERSGK